MRGGEQRGDLAAMHTVPEVRVTALHDAPPRQDGDFVLYWMIASRRATWNFALQRAVEWAREFRKPLVVLEALRCDYPWASDRLHAFVLQGMADNARRFAKVGVTHYAYVEPARDAGKGLLAALAARACAVVTDEFPCFFLPRMVHAAAHEVRVRFEQVDANGLLPLRVAPHAYPTAYVFRRFLQKSLRPHLVELPAANPLARARLPVLAALPADITRRWPAAGVLLREPTTKSLSALPIDHDVAPGIALGGTTAARRALAALLDSKLDRYHEDRNRPDAEATSGLSPWLHFGHLGVHEVFDAIARHEGWMPDHLSDRADGRREGWWRMRVPAEEFLDQVVTWRELGSVFCHHRPKDYDRFESLPEWAQATLAAHAADPRSHLYSRDEFEAGRTHDALWNAAQRQLVCEGRMHNYLRMLWGKKVIEWSPSPAAALATLLHLNNKYAVDGRDPNSYSGIFWCFGRFDRPWAPERPIFGVVRWMSSANTARKFPVRGYIEKYTGNGDADDTMINPPTGRRRNVR
jgi:deoxyribodipyrimidine photo-lyase